MYIYNLCFILGVVLNTATVVARKSTAIVKHASITDLSHFKLMEKFVQIEGVAQNFLWRMEVRQNVMETAPTTAAQNLAIAAPELITVIALVV